MSEYVTTAIGRVVPSYRGEWRDNIIYDKLDNVLYNGSTYVALKSVPVGIQPDSNLSYWQLLARKGDVGSIRQVYASATSSDQPTASARIVGEDPSQKDLILEFGLPKGDTGDPAAITHVNAAATQIGYSDPPQVTATITGDPGDATLNFEFFIPGAQGSVSEVDGVTPRLGNIPLQAVSFGINQTEDPTSSRYISEENATQARNNIRAASKNTTINGKSLSTDIELTAADVDAVPTSRTINNKALSNNISLTAADVGAVPTSRTVNNKALSNNISLTAADVGAYVKPSSGIPASDLASGVIPTVPAAYTSNPAMNGTASPGNSGNWARGNHVHPSDTSRQTKITTIGILKGTGNGIISTAVAGTDYVTPATNYSSVITKSSNYTLAASELGKTIVVGTSSSGDVTITINQTVLGSLPPGAEIAFIKDNRPSDVARLKIVNIGFGNEGTGWIQPNANGVYVVIPERYGMIALKKIFDTNNTMMLFGNVEVVS